MTEHQFCFQAELANVIRMHGGPHGRALRAINMLTPWERRVADRAETIYTLVKPGFVYLDGNSHDPIPYRIKEMKIKFREEEPFEHHDRLAAQALLA